MATCFVQLSLRVKQNPDLGKAGFIYVRYYRALPRTQRVGDSEENAKP